MDALLHEFERAERGKGRLVALSAEAGIGKTTILDAFISCSKTAARLSASAEAGARSGWPEQKRICRSSRCSTACSTAKSTAACRGCCARVAPSWYVQITPLAENDSSAARLAADVAIGSQERLEREIGALLDEITRMHPVVLCFDDVHWADPSTTDLIRYLGAADRHDASADHRHVPAVRAGADETSIPSAEAGSRVARRVPGDLAGIIRRGCDQSLSRAAVRRSCLSARVRRR